MPPFKRLTLLFLVLLCGMAEAKEDPYFAKIAAELLEKRIARPVVILDLDRLEANLTMIRSQISPPLQLRLVDKSLPSIPLLNYLLEQTQTTRVMVFHPPFLPHLLADLPPDTDFLFGKPLPEACIDEVLSGLQPERRVDAARRVQWLVDTPERLEEMRALSRRFALPLRINLEIDVGLRRGGVSDLEGLRRLLGRLQEERMTLTFTGFMGYEAHVTHVPSPKLFGINRAVTSRLLHRAWKRYEAFVKVLEAEFPLLRQSATTFNGAGSSTYFHYGAQQVVNEVSVGSAFLKPADFDIPGLEPLSPAIWIATPVLKEYAPARLPVIGRVALRRSVKGYYLFGGGFAEKIVYPGGLKEHFLTRGPPGRNLISNQTFVYGKPSAPLTVGDFVFYRPDESDALYRFERLLLFRSSHLVGEWRPLDARY